MASAPVPPTDGIGQAGTFWLFAGFSVIAFVWITARVPETKGRTLEEIEASFVSSSCARLTLQDDGGRRRRRAAIIG